MIVNLVFILPFRVHSLLCLGNFDEGLACALQIFAAALLEAFYAQLATVLNYFDITIANRDVHSLNGVDQLGVGVLYFLC